MDLRPSVAEAWPRGRRVVVQTLRDATRAHVIRHVGRLGNLDPDTGGSRTSLELLQEGGVRAVCSVGYSHFDEAMYSPLWHVREARHRGRRYHWAPAGARALPRLHRQLDLVERHVERSGGHARVARNRPQLDHALRAGALAVVHCVEGAFHLGADVAGMDAAVAGLKRRGVVYLTLGHLWFKAVAHVAPSWATIGEDRWEQFWPQPPGVGLAPLGRAAVEACVRHRLPLDVTHLSERSLKDLWQLLDVLDPDRALPVLASHTAVRQDGLQYALSADTIRRIAERDGIVGLISSDHQLQAGWPPRNLAETAELLANHVRAIEHITGTTRHAALGTDLGGFVTPAAGLENASQLGALRQALGAELDDEALAATVEGNAMRFLRRALAETDDDG